MIKSIQAALLLIAFIGHYQENYATASASSLRNHVIQGIELKNDFFCLETSSCPSGLYSNTCVNCNTNANGALFCNCPCTSGANCIGGFLAAVLQNSWACEKNIIADPISGNLQCKMPSGNWFGLCSQCGIMLSDIFFCAGCLPALTSTQVASVSSCEEVNVVNSQLVCASKTPAPTASLCIWSPETELTGEKSPTEPCSAKTTHQGCEYNNFCCWNASEETCGNYPSCQECVGLTEGSCNANNRCCTYNPALKSCTRRCPDNEQNFKMCGN